MQATSQEHAAAQVDRTGHRPRRHASQQHADHRRRPCSVHRLDWRLRGALLLCRASVCCLRGRVVRHQPVSHRGGLLLAHPVRKTTGHVPETGAGASPLASLFTRTPRRCTPFDFEPISLAQFKSSRQSPLALLVSALPAAPKNGGTALWRASQRAHDNAPATRCWMCWTAARSPGLGFLGTRV